jgi:cytochrome b subunit of formate dehydrogenase
MSNGRTSKLWMVNVIAFILFIVIGVTGLLNWLVLPRGYEMRGSFLVSLRHLFISLHEWAALLFIIVIAIHVALHWPYVKSNLRNRGVLK